MQDHHRSLQRDTTWHVHTSIAIMVNTYEMASFVAIGAPLRARP